MRGELRPGTVLDGTYRIIRLIGEGGMGTVYEASHARLAGRYAVKVLQRDIQKQDEALARFRREAQITSALRHPGIVAVIDFQTPAKGPPFLVMEYLEGAALGDVIAREAPFPLARAVEIAGQIASALAAAHRQGVVHRDLNPHNVFLLPAEGDQPERVKLLDFGISKIRSVSKPITGSAQVLGTPQYMAPEQAEGRTTEIDELADQFSLAAIAYQMLTARPPFTGDTLAAVAYRIVHAQAPPIARFRPDIPRAVERVVARGLAKDKRARFPSVTDLAGQLRRACRPRGEGAEPEEPEVARNWTEAETVVSAPPQKPVTTLGRQTGELSRPGLVARVRARWPALAAGAAGVVVIALALSLGPSPRRHHAPPVTSTAPAPGGPTVQPLPHPPAAATAAVASAPSDASFDLASEPPGLPVFVDGRPFPDAASQTRTRARGYLPPGRHTFELARDGYAPWRRTVIMRAGFTTPLHAKLEKTTAPMETAAVCTLTVGSSPWAQVWIDWRDTGAHTPVVQMTVTCGKHTLGLRRPDLKIDHEVDVTLTAGKEFKARYQLGAPE